MANPGQNPASVTTSRENSRENSATDRKVTQNFGHLSYCPSRGLFGTVIHPQHNVTKKMEQIFRRAPGPNARLATQISWQKPRGSPPPKVSTWPFPVAGGGLPGSLTCLDVIQGRMFSHPRGRNQISRTPPIRFYDSEAGSREQVSRSRLHHEDDGRSAAAAASLPAAGSSPAIVGLPGRR